MVVARSAVEMGFEFLRQNNGDTDSLSDAWARGELDLEWEGRSVSVRVVDEESKFPLSRLQQDPSGNDALGEALVRFFENAGLRTGKDARDQFLDWVDSDMVRRTNGAEGADYASGRVKDAPMDSLYELRALPAWADMPYLRSPRQKTSADDLGLNGSTSLEGTLDGTLGSSGGAASPTPSPSASAAQASPGISGNSSFGMDVPKAETQGKGPTSEWDDWMSVNSSGKINVNTAPKELLLCLDDEMTDVLVEEIDAQRRSNAFANVNDLRNVTGMSNDLLFRIKDYLSVKSQVFEIRAVVKEYPGRVTLKVLVDRANGELNVVRWEVN